MYRKKTYIMTKKRVNPQMLSVCLWVIRQPEIFSALLGLQKAPVSVDSVRSPLSELSELDVIGKLGRLNTTWKSRFENTAKKTHTFWYPKAIGTIDGNGCMEKRIGCNNIAQILVRPKWKKCIQLSGQNTSWNILRGEPLTTRSSEH